MPLSPEARGTLAALKELRCIKCFTPDCAEALVAAGLAQLERDDVLVLTQKGALAAAYADAAPFARSATSHA